MHSLRRTAKVMVTGSAMLGCGLFLVAGCDGSADTASGGPQQPSPIPSASLVEPTAAASSKWPLCAEFPDMGSNPGDGEGWWNATPADASGNVIYDPSQWRDKRLREHPRVALVDTASGHVVATYDRVACGPIPGYAPKIDAEWPPRSIVIIDVDSGKVVDEPPPS